VLHNIYASKIPKSEVVKTSKVAYIERTSPVMLREHHKINKECWDTYVRLVKTTSSHQIAGLTKKELLRKGLEFYFTQLYSY